MPRLTPHAKHLSKGYCPEIDESSQGWCLEKLGHPGKHQAGKDIHWSTERQFSAGWLQDQISKAAASLDGLDPQVRATLSHRTGKDNAAGIRGTISRLESLNDDGTPAPPAEQDSHDSQAEPVTTRRGRITPVFGLPFPQGESMAVENQVEVGNAYMLALQAEIAPDGTVEERPSEWSRQILDDVLKATQTVLNIHLVQVSDNRRKCVPRCAGPGKHLDEYRAAGS